MFTTKIRLSIASLALAALAACSNDAQLAAGTKAATDAGACLVAVVPSVAQIATTKGQSDVSKATASGTVVVQAATSVKPCGDIAGDVKAAVDAGKQVSVTPVQAPVTSPTTVPSVEIVPVPNAPVVH